MLSPGHESDDGSSINGEGRDLLAFGNSTFEKLLVPLTNGDRSGIGSPFQDQEDHSSLFLDDSMVDMPDEEAKLGEILKNVHPQTRVLFKGRKYNWQAKINLHIHVIEHQHADILEIIGFNTSTFVEADHIYLSAAQIKKKVDNPSALIEKMDTILFEYQKIKIVPPTVDVVQEAVKMHLAATFILDHLHVNVKHHFDIDVKDSDRALRISSAPKAGLPPLTNDVAVSLTIRKPEIVFPTTIKRFGHSATLVGEPVGFKVTKEEEILTKIIMNLNSVSLSNQARRIINRVTLLSTKGSSSHHSNRRTLSFQPAKAANQLEGFAKFRNDNDLLEESLSFLHVSDWLEFMTVCKKWHQVLSHSLKNTHTMVLTSRDYYFHHNRDRDQMVSRGNTSSQRGPRRPKSTPHSSKPHTASSNHRDNDKNDEEEGEDDELREDEEEEYEVDAQGNQIRILYAPKQFKVRNIFLLSETVERLVRAASKHIVELRLHYVILHKDMIGYLSSLTGRLKTLCLGVIKIDDNVYESPVIVAPVPVKEAKPPNNAPPSTHSRSILQNNNSRRNTKENIILPHPPTAIQAPVIVKRVAISRLRFMNGADLKAILFSCGSELTHLEINAAIGEISPEIFKYTPKLAYFSATETLLAPVVRSVHKDLDGNILMQDLISAWSGHNITAPELLTLMADSATEALLLTDKRGKVVTANEPWERMFGHSRVDIVGSGLEFLAGDMTDHDEYEIILEGLKHQLRAEEVTIFLAHANGQPLMAQVIMIPNIVKFKGAPLSYDCLDEPFLMQMALEQEEAVLKKAGTITSVAKMKMDKSRRDWRMFNKELSYHILRFGFLSEPFVPYKPSHTKIKKGGGGDGGKNSPRHYR